MKRDFYTLISVLAVGILGTAILIWLQNASLRPRIIQAQDLPITNITDPNNLNADYPTLLSLYGANQCEEQILKGSCSDTCRQLVERINLEEEKIASLDPVLKKTAATAPARSPASPKTSVPKKAITYGLPAVGGVRFTSNPAQVSCPVKNDKPGKSSYKKKHYDEDCCIDYDEWLRPGCTYISGAYDISLNHKLPPPSFSPKK